MTFQFPFPTLKNLSMIRIGQAVLQKRTRLLMNYYRYLGSLDHVNDDDYGYEEIPIEDLVPSLVQIRELQHDLADVIHSMLEQTHTICRSDIQRETNAEDVTLIFDVHGRLDVAAVWRYYFEDQLNNAESVEPAKVLLDFALQRRMWCEIGAIIIKIMSLLGLESNSLPKPKMIRNEYDEYMLVYSLGVLISDPSSANVISRLRWTIEILNLHISINGNCLYVPMSMLCWDYVFIREFFIAMDKSDKESFIQQIIPCLRESVYPSKFAAEIITDLDDVMLGHLMVKVSEGQKFRGTISDAAMILYNILHWPLSQFFMPLLELLSPFLKTNDYADLFTDIVSKIHSQSGFGFLYPNLLTRFCRAIPLNVKQKLLKGSKVGRRFTGKLESLRHDNSELHDRIVKILCPQVE